MKKLTVVLILLVNLACKNEHKTQSDTVTENSKEAVIESTYPELIEFTKEVNFIYYDEHHFDDRITCSEIAYFKDAEGHNFLVYFTETTDLETLSNYDIIFMVYPEDKSKLISEKDKARGFELVRAPCEIMMDGKAPVVIVPKVNLNYSRIEKIRSYLSNKNGILNPEKPKLSTEPFEL
jgi:hypothetical protein